MYVWVCVCLVFACAHRYSTSQSHSSTFNIKKILCSHTRLILYREEKTKFMRNIVTFLLLYMFNIQWNILQHVTHWQFNWQWIRNEIKKCTLHTAFHCYIEFMRVIIVIVNNWLFSPAFARLLFRIAAIKIL